MENLFTNSVYSYDITKCNKTFILSFIAASFFCNIVTGTNVINENQFLPDSTNHEPYTYGDTVEICADGVDSIIYIYDGFNDTTNYERSISSKDIIVTLGNDLLPVQDGIFGVSLEAFFFDTHANEANNSHYTFPNPNPWQLLEMYAPKTLRFPGGAAGKFRHLLGSTNSSDTDNEFHDLKNGGYGINIEDVIDFYDLTDDEANRPVLFSTIVTDMDNSRDLTWILEEWKEQFGDVYDAWYKQPHFDPSEFIVDDIEEVWNEDDLYINQFIRLVKAIEDYNPGLRINVILCLNIFSEPQENWKAVVDYLRDEDLNHQYSVNVVGIEVGNETYMDVFGDALGFEMSDGVSAFEHYWAYINGVDDYSTEFTNDDDFTLSDVLTNNGMVGHHDFLGEFKNDEDYDFLKLGLPAENADVDDGAFIIGDDEDQPIDLEIPVDCSSWNTCLYQHYNDLISGKPAFDAVIPHEYYKAQNSGTPAYNTNWGEIPLCLDNVAGGDHQNFNTDLYTYATADARLSCAFDNLVTTGTGTKNFREFITSRQRDAVLDLSIELGFDDSEPHPKECWVTEWNLKNNSNYADDAEGDAKDLRRDVYMNSFAHAYLLQEEMLNYMKFNCHTSLREGFMPYTTLQNFLDGSATDLVRLSSLQDQIENDIYTSCTGGLGYNYYMARTTYYSTRLMNQIALLDLDFLKTTSLIYTSNVNKSVTFFSKELENEAETQTVYGYFTNVKDEPETYIIKPGTFTGVSLAGTQAEIHCVQAKRLYSRSGMGAVYEINDEYGCDAGGIADFFEIKGELAPYMDNTTCPINMPSGAMCVNVPAYSCGYFVFTFDIGLRLGDPLSQYNLYPNPASTNFSIQQTNAEINNIEDLEIDIYNINGVLIQTIYNVYEGKSIDVTQLPVGVYNVLIKPKGSPTESETLVKMK